MDVQTRDTSLRRCTQSAKTFVIANIKGMPAALPEDKTFLKILLPDS